MSINELKYANITISFLFKSFIYLFIFIAIPLEILVLCLAFTARGLQLNTLQGENCG